MSAIQKKMIWIIFIIMIIAGAVFLWLSNSDSKELRELRPGKYFSGCHLELYKAAQKEDLSKITFLKKDCNIELDAPGIDDITLLALAVINADGPAIKSLVTAGANPFHVIEGAGSPAVMAISRHYDPPRVEALEALAAAGMDFNHNDGKPYLFYFADYPNLPGLQLAVVHGADVNIRTESGETLLTYVVAGQHMTMARWLIAHNADPALTSDYGDSPLNYLEFAISRGDPSTPEWQDLVAFREEILAMISDDDPRRRTLFTEVVEQRIKGAE